MKQPFALKTSKQYDRDVKLAKRLGLDIEKLLEVIKLLRNDEPLPANLHNHLLSGIPRYALSPSIAQERMPTFSAKAENDKPRPYETYGHNPWVTIRDAYSNNSNSN
jgi:mRNA-degrading endonuclease YafQ of YafQ-DinJ toxin-antitoxin module